MVAHPSLESINASYENKIPGFIRVHDNGVVRIMDEASDGDETCLPPAGELVPLEDDTVDALVAANERTVKRWLKRIGNYLIREGRGHWHHQPEDRVYTLKCFPKGYRLYTHKKGDKNNPREDHYLHGSTSPRCRRFRSPEEFVLHCKWLAFGKPSDDQGRPLCGCRYCSGRKQGEISDMLKGKVSHLDLDSSSSDTESIDGEEHRRSRASKVPVMAKDYTHLNQGESVSVWVQGRNTLSEALEQ